MDDSTPHIAEARSALRSLGSDPKLTKTLVVEVREFINRELDRIEQQYIADSKQMAQCPVCFATHKEGARFRILVTCYHSICNSCLVDMHETNDGFMPPSCPMCRCPMEKSHQPDWKRRKTISVHDIKCEVARTKKSH